MGESQIESVKTVDGNVLSVNLPTGVGFVVSVTELTNPDEECMKSCFTAEEDSSKMYRIVIQHRPSELKEPTGKTIER